VDSRLGIAYFCSNTRFREKAKIRPLVMVKLELCADELVVGGGVG